MNSEALRVLAALVEKDGENANTKQLDERYDHLIIVRILGLLRDPETWSVEGLSEAIYHEVADSFLLGDPFEEC